MTAPTTFAFRGRPVSPWATLGAMCVGFFMILVDMTIVSVAQPTIQEKLHTDMNGVAWVTSAYLLTYAVPLLITGRLGDRVGPKNLYQLGLIIFTVASVWCGLSGSITELIIARGLQGLGAALITPQTMAVITRVFPADKRGAAMGLWGTVAGVATLVGPLVGGVLVDNLGWQWIFYINVPFGIIGVVLAWALVPQLPTNEHKFDIVGLVLSAIGLTAIVFAVQDGERYNWAGWIWSLIVAGVLVMVVFVWWQSKTRSEPLVPLSLFRDRNFSLSSIGIAAMGFTVTGMLFPLNYFLQLVGGMSPTRAALVTVPMAVMTGILAPIIGKAADKLHPRSVIMPSFLLASAAIWMFAMVTRPDTPVWVLLIPMALLGIGSAGIWAPLAATANRNLPLTQAGAAAGVYNTVRQVGSVIGSAAIFGLLQMRMSEYLPGMKLGEGSRGDMSQLPEPVLNHIKSGFSDAIGETLYLPAAMLLLAAAVSWFFVRPKPAGVPVAVPPAESTASAGVPAQVD